MSGAILNIRRADMGDIQNIAAAEKNYIDCPWSEKQIIDELAKDNALFFVADCDGEFAGYVSAVCAADECEIANVAVLDAYRRKGIATKLLLSLISAAKDVGARAVFLLVNEHNVGAQSLYKKLGFTELGRRAAYYGNNDAVSMRLNV